MPGRPGNLIVPVIQTIDVRVLRPGDVLETVVDKTVTTVDDLPRLSYQFLC